MPEELGKIEKPPAEEFTSGRNLFFVPMVFSGKDFPLEFVLKIDNYWDEVESHLTNLESKLGTAKHIYHELIPASGEEGIKLLKELNSNSYNIVQSRLEKGAILEVTEDDEILSELMDWSRCLSIGLQNQKVFSRVYEFYTEANKKRNEFIARKIDETLHEGEPGILIMAEGHHIQFPSNVNVFYISPPSLDEIKRWLRDYEEKAKEREKENPPPEQ